MAGKRDGATKRAAAAWSGRQARHRAWAEKLAAALEVLDEAARQTDVFTDGERRELDTARGCVFGALHGCAVAAFLPA